MRTAVLTARDSAPRLLPVPAPLVTVLVVSRSWRAVAAVALAALALLAVCGPLAALSLIPLSLAGGLTATLPAVAVVTLVVAVRPAPASAGPPRRTCGSPRWPCSCSPPSSSPPPGLAPQPDRLADLIGPARRPRSGRGRRRVTPVAAGDRARHRADRRASPPESRWRSASGRAAGSRGSASTRTTSAPTSRCPSSPRPAWRAGTGSRCGSLPAAACLAGMVATQSRGAFVAGVAGVAIVVRPGTPARDPGADRGRAPTAAGMVFPGALGAAERPRGRRPEGGGAELRHRGTRARRVVRGAGRGRPSAARNRLRNVPALCRKLHRSRHLPRHARRLPAAGGGIGIPALIAFLVLVGFGVERRGPAISRCSAP